MEEKLSIITELIKLANSDKNLRDEEFQFIIAISKMIGLTEADITPLFDKYIDFVAPKPEFDRILQFQRLVLVANVDRNVDLHEIEFLKDVGLKMGLHPDAVEFVLSEMTKHENGLIPSDILINTFQVYHN